MFSHLFHFYVDLIGSPFEVVLGSPQSTGVIFVVKSPKLNVILLIIQKFFSYAFRSAQEVLVLLAQI